MQAGVQSGGLRKLHLLCIFDRLGLEPGIHELHYDGEKQDYESARKDKSDQRKQHFYGRFHGKFFSAKKSLRSPLVSLRSEHWT